MVSDRLDQPDAESGFILDGFPRTVSLAEALAGLLHDNDAELDAVVELNLPADAVVKRLLGRGRFDDTGEVIRRRQQVYRNDTAPLLAFYRSRQKVDDGAGSVLGLDGMLPSRATNVCALSTASALVSRARTISTNAMTGTGEKKCSPSTRLGSRTSLASRAIGIADVFDAMRACSPTMPSSILMIDAFRSTFSDTASITRSAPPRPVSPHDLTRSRVAGGWRPFVSVRA